MVTVNLIQIIRLIKHNRYSYFIELFTASFILFLLQIFISMYILADTVGRAGFELHKDISIYFFYFFLFIALLCTAAVSPYLLKIHRIRQYTGNLLCHFIVFVLSHILFFTLTIAVVALSFTTVDIVRWICTPFFSPLDNFFQFCFPETFSLQLFNEFLSQNLSLIIVNLLIIGSLAYMLFLFCGYFFRKYALAVAFFLTAIILYGLYKNGGFTLYAQWMNKLYETDNRFYYQVIYGLVTIIFFLVMTVCFFIDSSRNCKALSNKEYINI